MEAATDAYMARIPASSRARSDAYFEGGYWLILWDFLYGAVIALLLLNLRWSAAMRDLAERITRFKPLQTFIYWVEYSVVTFVLGAPLAIYEGYTRERQYGLATQTFGPWAWDQTKGLMLGIVLGGILAMALFGIVRRLPRTWWIWGAVVTALFMVFSVMIVPVFIVPIFNKVTRLDDPKVTAPILSLARANGIPAKDVWTMDASKQTTRMSANVSGFGQTMRVTLERQPAAPRLAGRNSGGDGTRDGTLCPQPHSQGPAVLLRRDCGVLRLLALGAGVVPATLGREVANPRHRRHRGGAAGHPAGLHHRVRHSRRS